MLSDTEMTLDEAAKTLDLTPHELSLLINKGVVPSRMHIGANGRREKLLSRDAVDALRRTGSYRLLVKDSPPAGGPTTAQPKADTPEPTAAPEPPPAASAASSPAAAPDEPPTGEALQVALLQSLSSTQERLAAIERRLESLTGAISTDLAVKLAALPTKDDLRQSAAQVGDKLTEGLRPLTEHVASLTESLSNASTVQHQNARQQAEQMTQVAAGLAEVKVAAAEHVEFVKDKLNELFEALEVLPEILQSQGDQLGRLVEWSEDEQEKSPVRQIQKLGKLLGERRKGSKGKGSDSE